jgi:hypothetical protein
MEEEKANRSKEKKTKCAYYGAGSGLTAIGGGLLMIFGGPPGMIIGGIILGAGISGEVSTI